MHHISSRTGAGAFSLLALAAAAPTASAGPLPVTTPVKYQCTFPIVDVIPFGGTVSVTVQPAVLVNEPVSPAAVTLSIWPLDGPDMPNTELRSVLLNTAWESPRASGGTERLPRASVLHPDDSNETARGSIAGFTPTAPGTASLSIEGFTASVAILDPSGTPIADVGDASDSDRDPLTADVSCTGPALRLTQVLISAPPTPDARRQRRRQRRRRS